MSNSSTLVPDSVSSFLAKPRPMLINGEWSNAETGKTFEVFNPATGEVIGHVAEAEAADVDRAVQTARTAFDQGPWPRMTPAERAKILWKVADLIEQNADRLATLNTLDNGMPKGVSMGFEVGMSADMFRYMAGWCTKIQGNTIPLSVPYMPGMEFHAYTLREPVGVVGQIIPWNAPMVMASWKLAPALACGCTAVLKTAEQTPMAALMMGELMLEAGMPEGAVNIVTGFGETAGAALAAHPGVDKVAFTGSTEVGRLIVQAAIGNLKNVSLELGGKSPNVIFNDADLEAAIPNAAAAIFFNQGQVCCAGSRLFVQRDVFDEVIAGVASIADGMKLGDGLAEDTEMGPVVSKQQQDRICGFLERGQAAGARAVCGGGSADSSGYFVKPTVLVDTADDMEVVREEIFGPVVTAMPFDDIEELVPRANDSPYGLAAGVWTRDASKAHRVAKCLKAGTVWINSYNVIDSAMPFGGFKQSGWGREAGEEVLNNYLETKSVCLGL